MGRLALIGGHSILGHEPAGGMVARAVETEYGSVEVFEADSHVLLQRHGLSDYRTARRIEHRANLAALAELGVDRALSIASVGGLRTELVGTFLCPDDFIALHLGLSFFDEHGGERVPAFDGSWRERVLSVWARHSDVELRDGGVYWQTIGPRFETPAEIRLLASFADVVGMTVASECVLAGELGIAYATVCVVDNLANGVGGAPLAVEDFEAGKATNRDRLLAALAPLVDEARRRAMSGLGEGATSGLAVEGARLDGEIVGLRTEHGRIVEIGAGVSAGPGDRVLDGSGKALVPGLVNGHTHAAMTLFRGYADDLPLMSWLTDHIWPAEAKLTAEDVYWGARLACMEMIASGTVGFWDMYWQPGATARAVEDAGLRARIGAPLIDGDDPSGSPKLQDDAARGLEALEGSSPRIAPAFAPHAIYTVSEPSLAWIAERSAETGIPIHIHVSETEGEVGDCIAKHGVRPAEYLNRIGVLGPRTLLAHSVWLDDHERELIAESGASVVTNPNANMKLAVGSTFDLPAARDAGIPVALGTDGAGSNNSLDLLGEVKQLALVQKLLAGDAAAVTAAEAWSVATGARAPLLGATPAIEVGEAADFLLVGLDTPALALGSLEAGLVYAADATVVDATVVAGEVLLESGEPTAGDADEVIAKARESARRLGLA